jgi:transcriptional regulator with XRE-family HTH domain
MSELLRIIDDYKDAHGQPSDSSIARAIGVAPQTISSWRRRGIREAPAIETLRRMAEFMRLPYEEYVLQAALVDAGYRETMPNLDEARRREA